MQSVGVPHPIVVVSRQPPEIEDARTLALSDRPQQLVVDRAPAAREPEDGSPACVVRGEHDDSCTCREQSGQRCLVAGHHRVEVDRTTHQIIPARVDRDQIRLQRYGAVDLLVEHLIEQAATDREVGVAQRRVVDGELFCDTIGPSA
ncbi:Uncharacterised protein [Mycobacteroides abscessus subsp. abscessus]|nr:Uncharacterised protein [Mycobacteroides abscessus subsp. abscessus]